MTIKVLSTVLLCACGLVLAGVPVSARQGNSGTAGKVPIVAATGCLTETEGGRWRLVNATDAVVQAPQRRRRLNNDAAPAAPAPVEKPAQTSGTNAYVLLGLAEFNPTAHKGHTVTIKGLLIIAGADKRINVTVLQMISASCSPPRESQGE